MSRTVHSRPIFRRALNRALADQVGRARVARAEQRQSATVVSLFAQTSDSTCAAVSTSHGSRTFTAVDETAVVQRIGEVHVAVSAGSISSFPSVRGGRVKSGSAVTPVPISGRVSTPSDSLSDQSILYDEPDQISEDELRLRTIATYHEALLAMGGSVVISQGENGEVTLSMTDLQKLRADILIDSLGQVTETFEDPNDAVYSLHPNAGDECFGAGELSQRFEEALCIAAGRHALEIQEREVIVPSTRGGLGLPTPKSRPSPSTSSKGRIG
jgi:hypothetical protein